MPTMGTRTCFKTLMLNEAPKSHINLEPHLKVNIAPKVQCPSDFFCTSLMSPLTTMGFGTFLDSRLLDVFILASVSPFCGDKARSLRN